MRKEKPKKNEEIEVVEKKEKTERTPEEIKDLTVRLNRIEGQIRGIKNMVDRGDYCVDIMIQVSAANAAMNSFNRELLAQHIKTCIVKDVQEGKTDKIDELAELIKRAVR